MIYADYARRKMHNVVKLGTAEGYPLVINNAVGKKLKDYTIEGNTEYGENLFNYTEPLTNSIKADENGWFDVTIDNTDGTATKYAPCYTNANENLKPDTTYSIFVEIAEISTDVKCYAISNNITQTSTGQFVSNSILSNTTGIQKFTNKTRTSFDNCANMLRTIAFAEAGKSGHIKFRIAIYETEKDVFLPYIKTSVGDMTENLIPYPYEDTTKTLNGVTFTDNGDGSITVNGTPTEYSYFMFAVIPIMPSTTFTISKNQSADAANVAFAVRELDENRVPIGTEISIPPTVVTHTFTVTDNTRYIRITLKRWGSNIECKGTFKPMLELGDVATEYEPYNKYKIPIVVSGENNTTIYLNAPLADGESINYKTDNLPDIVLNKGTNTITTDTAVKPKKISAKYYKTNCSNRVKEYGVRWNGTASTLCDRLGNAVGLVANAHRGTTDYVQNDFDSIYPWSDIKTCNIDDSGNVTAYIGDATFKRDGSNGDVMVEIPKFYYKRVKTGIVEEVWICEKQLPGYELHPLFIDNGKKVSKVFHSVYNASSYTDETDNKVKLQSITGVQPRVRTIRSTFRTYARNKGAIWGIEDISCVNALQLLYLVEYANTNSQFALGSGADSLSYTANHKAIEETTNGNTITIASTYKNAYKLGQRIEIGSTLGTNNKAIIPRTITSIVTDDEASATTITFDGAPINISVGDIMWNVAPLNGSCDALNGKSGWLAGENNYTDHYADVNYRGIEGFHAKLFRFIDGVNTKDRVVYYSNSITEYENGVYDGKYRAVGYSNAEANGYVSAFGYDEKAPWVMFPSTTVEGSSTFVPDYYYQNTGERITVLGGTWYSGSNAGAFYFNCAYTSPDTRAYCGSHLLVKKP